ncbi:MAG: CoA-binding protein, partial [Nanoarchaeota archaeon]
KIKKPIIAIKGGITKQGSQATFSHTGSLAGDAEVYRGAFKQAGIILAESLEDMFNYARVLEVCQKPKGDRVQIITNGGGYGVISSDALNINNLTPAILSKENKDYLKKIMPERVIISNPMDLLGDTTTHRYKHALDACIKDKNIDIILLLVLHQTPLLTTSIVEVITEFNDMQKKPIIVVSTGGEFTQVLKKNLETNKIPCFDYPEQAVRAIKKLTEYYEK